MVWKIVVGLGVVLGVIMGVVEYDDRLAKSDDVKEDMKSLEVKVVQTLDQFQKNMDVRQYDYLEDSIERDYDNCRRELRQNPSDDLLKQDCEEIKDERDRIKAKKRSFIN